MRKGGRAHLKGASPPRVSQDQKRRATSEWDNWSVSGWRRPIETGLGGRLTPMQPGGIRPRGVHTKWPLLVMRAIMLALETAWDGEPQRKRCGQSSGVRWSAMTELRSSGPNGLDMVHCGCLVLSRFWQTSVQGLDYDWARGCECRISKRSSWTPH